MNLTESEIFSSLGDLRMPPMAAGAPDLALGHAQREDRPVVGGYSGQEWSTLRRRGREILRRARDPEACLRHMRDKVSKFFNSELGKGDLKVAMAGMTGAVTEAKFTDSDFAMKDADPASKGAEETAVSLCVKSNLTTVKEGLLDEINLGINSVDLRAKFGGEDKYLRGEFQVMQQAIFQFQQVCSFPALCSLCLNQVNQGRMASDRDQQPPNMEATRLKPAGAQGDELGAPAVDLSTPLPQRGTAAVGGPTGLMLSITPSATIGFSAVPQDPPAPRRQGKQVAMLADEEDVPIVIDMEAAIQAVKGKLVVARVLSQYPVDHNAVVNSLRGAWRLCGTAVPQRVTSSDGRFVVTFSEEGDRQRVLQAGSWHYQNDAVLIKDFDGVGNPVDVRLDSLSIWVQIHRLPIILKTEDMGWKLGKKLGTVLAVSHRNNQIVDEHLRVRVQHPVEKPLRKNVDITPKGSTKPILFDVKYEKLPNFCFCCGVVGHTTEKFCSMPKELRKASYSTDIRAPPYWASARRQIDFGKKPVKDKVITEVASVVKRLYLSASADTTTASASVDGSAPVATDAPNALEQLVLVGGGTNNSSNGPPVQFATGGLEASNDMAGALLNTNSGAPAGQMSELMDKGPGEHLHSNLGAPGSPTAAAMASMQKQPQMGDVQPMDQAKAKAHGGREGAAADGVQQRALATAGVQ